MKWMQRLYLNYNIFKTLFKLYPNVTESKELSFTAIPSLNVAHINYYFHTYRTIMLSLCLFKLSKNKFTFLSLAACPNSYI